MTEQEYWDGEFAKRQAAWEAGSFPALIETVALCGQFERQLPGWASDAILKRLMSDYWAEDGKRRGGKRGGYGSLRGSETARHKHYIRYRLAARYLRPGVEMPRDRQIALFKRVAEQLRSGPNRFAFGQWRSIEDSYNKVRDEIEAGQGAQYLIAGLD